MRVHHKTFMNAYKKQMYIGGDSYAAYLNIASKIFTYEI